MLKQSFDLPAITIYTYIYICIIGIFVTHGNVINITRKYCCE